MMLPPLLDRNAASPADKWLWIFIAVLVVGQVVAFWMLCREQVSQAEARHAMAQLEKTAMADCGQTVPTATPGNCAPGLAPARPGSDVDAVMQALR